LEEEAGYNRYALRFNFSVHKRCSVADVEGDTQSPVSVINLVQLNRSVTDQYCVNPGCSDPHAAGFSADYHLPLHPQFPLSFGFVTLQFR